MKKLFFTAIALVAFSGVSMASTIEVKDGTFVSELQNFEIQVDLKEEDGPCSDEYEGTYQALRDTGSSHEYAAAYARVLFNQCMARTYPSIQQ